MPNEGTDVVLALIVSFIFGILVGTVFTAGFYSYKLDNSLKQTAASICDGSYRYYVPWYNEAKIYCVNDNLITRELDCSLVNDGWACKEVNKE